MRAAMMASKKSDDCVQNLCKGCAIVGSYKENVQGVGAYKENVQGDGAYKENV